MEKVHFKELFDVSSGLSKGAKELANGDNPFLTFKTIFNNTFLPDEITDTANTNKVEQEKYSVQRGDVFLTRTSETTDELGMSSVALKDYPNAVFNGFSKRLRLKPGISTYIDLKYLGYFLRSRIFRDQVDAMSNTSTRASLNIEMINRLYIVLPDASTQERIGNTLYLLDDKIKNNNAINQNLEEQAFALFDLYFPSISDGQRTVGDYITPRRGKNLLSKNAVRGEIPVVAGGLEPATYHNVANTIAPVVTISASGANSGYVRLWNTSVWSSDSSYIDSTMTSNVYFWYVMLKKRQREIYDSQTGSAQPHIYPQHIAVMPIISLSDDTIAEYTKQVTPLFCMIGSNNAENQKLACLRDALLPKLMSGELDVSDIDN